MRYAVILVATLGLCGDAAGSFSGANGVVVFGRAGSSGQEPSLVAVDPATGLQQVLGTGAEPAWSPDGGRLAFVRNGTVYIARPDGTGATAVGTGDAPAWSADGGRLVVSRSDGKARPGSSDGIRQLYALGLADGSSVQLTDLDVDATLPAWSPDGATIAFATPTAVETIPAGGGTPAPLSVPGVTVKGSPSWSPDGRSLAFIDAAGQVWTSASDGSGARQITSTLSTSAGLRPAWSPDGRSIAFTSGADLCVTDLAGSVHRVTRTQKTAAPVLASVADWQPAPAGSATIFDAPSGPTDTIGCDWQPGARVELLDVNVSPSIVSLAAPKELVFVNHLGRPLTVMTTFRGEQATVAPGGYVGFTTEPGMYEFTVAGYPDGVPRRGTFVVTALGHVTAEAHAPLRYGSQTELSGAAGPAGGAVTVKAQAFGSSRVSTIATIKPSHGRWRVTVAPKITTTYEVAYGGATAERRLRVMPDLRVRRKGANVGVSLKPAGALARSQIFLFRLHGYGWDEFRSARVGRGGIAAFRSVPSGRYYVAFAGGDAFWSTATEPFTVRG